MRFIQRWALMRNTAPENVQEHSHQVAVLAHALAVIRNGKFGGQVDPGAVAVAALYHDASEILTGDMPTPIKYDNPAIQGAYRDVEKMAEKNASGDAAAGAAGGVRPHPHCAGRGDKTAGEGGGQALSSHQVSGGAQGGNLEFRQAAEQTRRALRATTCRRCGICIDTFLESFSLSLDELK